MLAVLAAIVAGIGAILAILEVNRDGLLGPWALLFIALFLLALHLVTPVALPWRKG